MLISKIIASIGLLLLLISCSTTNVNSSLNTAWRGKTVDQLIAQRGEPSQITRGANGHTYYIYTRSRSQPFPYPSTVNQVIVTGRGTSIGYSVPSTDPSTYTLHCQTTFELNKNNQIIVVTATEGC